MKYKTVVIDPPWNVGNGFDKKYSFHGQNKERTLPYQVMTDSEIAAFPIDDFAESECDLFMWTTHTKLPFALQLLELWGFKFHVLLTWDKLSGVCIEGFYRNTELVVYGYRGKKGIDLQEGSYIPTLFKAKPKSHSQKPDIFYSTIKERTKAPRIDIFARKRHYGFDAYGNQVETQIEIPLLLASFDDKTKTEITKC